MGDLWGEVLEVDKTSWESVLKPEERIGGPSPWGNSKYSTFEQCPYKYWVYFHKRMTWEIPQKALEIGGLFHECRARYYERYLELCETEISDEDLDAECERSLFELVDRCESVVPPIASEVRRLLRGWVVVHGPGKRTDDRNATLLVEPLIEVDKGWRYSTRLDRVVWSDEADGPIIMEIKTASRRSKDLLASYTMDAQFLGQQYCWRNSKYYQKYGPLKGFIVDLSVKTAEMQFPREIVPIRNDAIRDWERQRRNTYRNILMCGAEGYWPRMRSNCVKYGRPCGLRNHCAILGKGANPYPGYRRKSKEEY